MPQPAGVTNDDLAQLNLLLEAQPEPAAVKEVQPRARRA
jgi:hypothetical protein